MVAHCNDGFAPIEDASCAGKAYEQDRLRASRDLIE